MISPGAVAPLLVGQPVFGLPFDLARLQRRGPVIVVFLGGLSGASALENVQRLTAIWPRVDAEAGGMVGITRSPLEAARDFVPRHHVLFPVLCDESGQHTGAWGVGRAGGLAALLLRARPDLLRRAVSVVRTGQPMPEANPDQLPAAFVVGADGVVRYSWYGAGPSALGDGEALWAAVGS